MNRPHHPLPVLEYLTRQVSETLQEHDTTHLRYPTAISQTLGMRITDIAYGVATVEIDADVARHGNQQGTVHGGLLCELADAAIGTAHSTTLAEGESFTTIAVTVSFFRPVWQSTLRAMARPVQHGKTLSHYVCEIVRDDGKVAAQASSTIMTLRGDKAVGR
ncbi:MAG TPA: PaaI family thioesterase [Gammaproteobacteria bacterium]